MNDLNRIDEWLSSIEGANPANARGLLAEAIEKLDRLGDIGRPGRKPNSRELSVRKAPYVIVYRMLGGDVEIVAIYRTSQNR